MMNLTPEQIVQANLDYYNKREIDNFMSCFSNDIQVVNFSNNQVIMDGIEQCRKFYKALFDTSPHLYSTILNRIVFDNKVIDHESIVGRQGSKDALEIVAIYEVKENKIFKLTVIRK